MAARVATDEEVIEALRKHGGNKCRAAKELGMHVRTIQRRVPRLARKGWSPEHDMTKTVPDGFHVKGVSTYYDKDGKPAAQWVKSNIDHERQAELLREAVEAMASTIPKEKPRKAPKAVLADLLCQYTITDYHMGMLAWGEETGADWDLTIAEDMLVDWFGSAIAQSPDAERAVLAQLGDMLHWDGMDAVTPASKHLLDVDTRFPKLVRVVIRVMRRVIGMLLDKHQHVTVLCAEGNHDPAGSAWLRELLSALYENEPRVEVITRPDPYYCIEFGQVSLFYHHGHKKKPAQVDEVFVAKFRDVFGRTKFSYAHMGHMHHVEVKETSLMVVEQHRTLAAPDAYASRGGWVSGRDAKVITYHRERGEVGRVVISAAMLEAA